MKLKKISLSATKLMHKKVFQVLYIFILVLGATTGVVLVQRDQDMREDACNGKSPDNPRPTKKPVSNKCNIAYQENPSTFSGFSKEGELVFYIDPGGYQFNIALKKNVDECCQLNNDVLLDTQDAIGNKIETGLNVAPGDKICIYPVGYNGTPGGGWIEPEGNLCKGPRGKPKDISGLLNLAPEAVSVQCWGDLEVEEDCDFNDFVFVFAIEEEEVINGLSFKLRFQGITEKAENILLSAKLFLLSEEKASIKNVEVENDETGLYNLNFDETLENGNYTLLFKGDSHLQKVIDSINISGNNEVIDLGQKEEEQARAGDATGDNTISLKDIARISKFYTKLSVDVSENNSEMAASDINKDGKITIQDLALIAINWSELEVGGDEI